MHLKISRTDQGPGRKEHFKASAAATQKLDSPTWGSGPLHGSHKRQCHGIQTPS